MRTAWRAGLLFVVGCTKEMPPPPIANTPPPAVAIAAPARLAVGTGAFGTAHPAYFRGHDRGGQRWMALCQARRDTDGDGKIAVATGQHGGLFGDTVELFLVIGGGPGTPIEALVGSSSDGRWVAILRGGRLELVDATTGELREMKEADVASDARPGTAHRAAVFGPDRLAYVRHRPTGDALVVHELATHAERELPVKDRLWRIAEVGRLAQVYTIPREQPFPRLNTNLEAGECVGAPRSYSTYGQEGPDPTERWIDLVHGGEVGAPAKSMDRDEQDAARTDRAPQLHGEDMGPARWPQP